MSRAPSRRHHAAPAGPVFAEPRPGTDPQGFADPHPSDNPTYARIEPLLKTQVVSFEPSRGAADALTPLADLYGPEGTATIAAIEKAGRITFHCVGDTGASDTRKYRDELRVADQLTADADTTEINNRAAFFFHLGDVVYSFGESRYYYDQFYEPYRAYPGPIVAIAGNHDSFVVPGTAPEDEPLVIFRRNFCNEQPVVTPEAGSLHRTAMTLPGLYFTLDAPFVRIIALFSNALEDPGVISSEGGRWKGVPDVQLAFLRTQLERIKSENYAGAVILATHHPAFSYRALNSTTTNSGNHDGSSGMLRDIDTICAEVGLYPHAVLAAHAHNYQRYTRAITDAQGRETEVPFIVCGNGGYNVVPLARNSRSHPATEPENGSDAGWLDPSPAVNATGLTLEKYDDHEYGYLRVTVDARQLRIAYHQAGVRSLLQSRYDLVTVDLASRMVVAN